MTASLTRYRQSASKTMKNWMDLVRLAFKLDPQKSKEIMSRITENDKKISELTGQFK